MNNARKILLIDDDTAQRRAFEQALTGQGHAVVTAASAEEALWKLDHGRFDCVVAEVALRGMSGLDMAEEIHVRHATLAVLLVADQASDAVRQQARDAGVSELLHKPLRPEQLAAKIDVLPRGAPSLPVLQADPMAADSDTEQTISKPVQRIKNVILFLLAPFVGLVYLLSFPLVGVGMLSWMLLGRQKPSGSDADALGLGVRAKRGPLQAIAMFPGTLLVGLFYAVAGPILGIGVLIWFGFQAWGKVGAKAIST